MTPLGCWGWVHEAFSEEELETSKTGGLTPSGTVQMEKKRFFYFENNLRKIRFLIGLKGQSHELRMRDFLPLGALTQ